MNAHLRPFVAAAALFALGGCAMLEAPAPVEAAPVSTSCPAEVPADARCLAGTDSAGAPYLIAMPAQWNRVLVVHAHGGPSLGAPKAERTHEDATRWAIVVKTGHALALSAFRQGGVAVRSAAEDTERVRRIFVTHVAQPRRTLLHGQSWGAGVAAIAAEMYPASWDGVLLSSGVLAGGTAAYDFRLDLRVVYQHLCGNHPAPGEPAYPLWQGLPPGSKLTREQLATRADECLGLRRPAAQRSPEQARKLKTIVDVIRIPENQVLAHLNWATWHFQDIVFARTDGRNPFTNVGARYRGSDDDEALNAAVARYAADPAAYARFAADADPTGRIRAPVLTVHGIHDATAFVEMDHAFLQTMRRAGTADRLVQTFTDDAGHSYLADPMYGTLFAALVDWVDGGPKPEPRRIAEDCKTRFEPLLGAGCRFLPDYRPQPLDARVPPRQRPRHP